MSIPALRALSSLAAALWFSGDRYIFIDEESMDVCVIKMNSIKTVCVHVYGYIKIALICTFKSKFDTV